MLVIIAIVITAAGIWLFLTAFNQAKSRLAHVGDEEAQRFAVDPYIWSPQGRAFRTKYVLGHALLVLGLAAWTLISWGQQPFLTLVFGVLGMIFAILLIMRCVRYGL